MSEEWKSIISETTDAIRQLPAEKEARENKLEENSAQVETMFVTIIIPTLKELKKELDNNTPASVTSSDKPFSDRVEYRASITVKLSKLLPDVKKSGARSANYPEFFYQIAIDAFSSKLSYNSTCHITDATGLTRELGGTKALPTTFDLTSDSIPDLTSDNIKQDFGLRYKDSVGFLRTTHYIDSLYTQGN
ncbi:MAG TPA: hypothetical protein VF393_01830 [archaeon]